MSWQAAMTGTGTAPRMQLLVHASGISAEEKVSA